jgi:hypothetical protein
MKHLPITIYVLTNINLFRQVRNFNEIPKDILKQLDKMEVDKSPLLNSYESATYTQKVMVCEKYVLQALYMVHQIVAT